MTPRVWSALGITSLMAGFGLLLAPQQGLSAPDLELENGKKIYQQYCASCHGLDGKGNGPAAKGWKPAPTNLALGTLKYAKGLPATEQVIAIGVPKTAMPPWAGLLKDNQIKAVAKYVLSLRD